MKIRWILLSGSVVFFSLSIVVVVVQQRISQEREDFFPTVLLELASAVQRPAELKEALGRAEQEAKKTQERAQVAQAELKRYLSERQPEPENGQVLAYKGPTPQQVAERVRRELAAKRREVQDLRRAQEQADKELERVMRIAIKLSEEQLNQNGRAWEFWLAVASFVVSFLLALSTIITDRWQIKLLRLQVQSLCEKGGQ